ncbi:hypothetical protein D854_gp23 [Streptomyces phage R4]|uniref:Uncharacterized protein n=2 Tax=Arequatrovirus TaxID=1982881 RepID=K4IBD3_9CAUD|nr:hypothetical protein D854_gp23 [Streptomyces phage R4]YP_009591523.1 hypothetical protein FDG59_gp20 [Streptomyces phage phiELB20]AFO10930.1 hypothetical protein ELB20_64 [Streptomyces phage phiELB20]AFU62119.1 hypothetical protein R4_65 [Streptomyces phage R4]
MTERVKIGMVDVDSGTVFVGDPCYTITGDASHHIKTWSEWCDKFPWDKKNYDVTEPAGSGIGLSIPTMYGDGSYPVYAEIEEGRVARVTIDFNPEYDEEDDEDE